MMTSRFFEKPQGEVTWYRCKALENKAQKTHKMRKAFSVNSALHPKADVRCEKLQCQQLAQSQDPTKSILPMKVVVRLICNT
jgi:hypothetical protein